MSSPRQQIPGWNGYWTQARDEFDDEDEDDEDYDEDDEDEDDDDDYDDEDDDGEENSLTPRYSPLRRAA